MTKDKEIFEQSPVELLTQQRNYHLKRIAEHQKEIELIDKLLSPSKKESSPVKKTTTKKQKVKSPNISWVKEARKFWRQEVRLFKIAMLVDRAYPDIDKDTRKIYLNRCSVAIANMRKTGECKGYQIPGDVAKYYGISQWFDGDELKEKYLGKIKGRQLTM